MMTTPLQLNDRDKLIQDYLDIPIPEPDVHEKYDPWWKIQTPTPMEEEVDDIQSSEEDIEIFEIKCETQPDLNSLNDLNLPAPRPPTPRQFIDTPLSPDPIYTYTFFNDII